MAQIRIQHVDHVTLNITDLERSKSFYGTLLGLKETPRPESFKFPGMWFKLENLDLHLVVRPEKDAPSARHFCFMCVDVHEAAQVFEERGIALTWDRLKIAGIDRFFISDPDGNRLEFQGPEAK
jgi:catechol 2,3-dioxygenase-like lactoylglutathione lyase family enzyme